MRVVLIVVLCVILQNVVVAQCSVSSSDGYTVNISLEPVGIVAPSSCPWGYNYNVEVSYNITYTGTPPANLYTLQGYLTCGSSSNLYFDLPNQGGDTSGVSTTTSNPYSNTTDCATATPASLNCDAVDLQISGPGIGDQTTPCASAGALPIELGSFTLEVIEANKVLVSWETITEVNNDFFTLEKSLDGRNWAVLINVKGAGNSSQRKSYKYLDRNPVEGVTYYRLKQTDYNGEYKYFQPIFANAEKMISENKNPELYPNPFENQITIHKKGENFQSLQVLTIHGKEVPQSSYTMQSYEGAVTLDLSSCRSGMYLIRTQDKIYRVFKK